MIEFDGATVLGPLAGLNAVLALLCELGLGPQPQDDWRDLDAYPAMPPGTCCVSSCALAQLYPELSVRWGWVTWVGAGGVDSAVNHAWCATPVGRIVDSTLRLPAGAREIEHWEHSATPAGRLLHALLQSPALGARGVRAAAFIEDWQALMQQGRGK